MKRVVFTDIDGTLMWGLDINEKNKYAIKKARENGHKIFISTGRSKGSIPHFILDNIEFDGIIASLGAEVYAGGETLKCEILGRDEVKKLVKYYMDMGIGFVAEGVDSSYACNLPTYPDGALFKDLDYENENFRDEITKMYVVGKPTDEHLAYLKANYEFYIHPTYFEYAQKGCTKAVGLEIAAKHLNADLKDCIAIGDSSNDLEMLKAVGIPVCVENSVDALKEFCVYRTCHAKDGALYDCFVKYGLI